jgi:hypothetical protein
VVDADVIGVPGVHVMVSKSWDRACNGLWRDLTERARRLRAAHRTIFTNLVRALEGLRTEGRCSCGATLLRLRGAGVLRQMGAGVSQPSADRNGARVPYDVDVIAFEPSDVSRNGRRHVGRMGSSTNACFSWWGMTRGRREPMSPWARSQFCQGGPS